MRAMRTYAKKKEHANAPVGPFTTFSYCAYGYNVRGEVVFSRRDAEGAENQYDDLDRLSSDGGVSYTYDVAGNRTTKTENGKTITYSLGAGDRLASWTDGAYYSYDAAGCVTRIERDGKPTLDLTWIGQYQLVSVSTNGVFAEGYAYDALGHRVSTTTAEGTTRHVYDDNWQVIADIDEQGNAIVSYTWGAGIDNLLAVKIGGATYYPLTDIQGTAWGYVDTQNNIVARWQYDAWGNVVDEEISSTATALASLRYRFQGREWSAATGLINFRMRWYDPETGRWLSKDPIGLNGGLNLFVFCGCRPIDYLDPFGYARIRTRPLDAGEKAYVKNAFTWTVSRINLPGDIDPRHREIFFEDGNDTDECPGSIGYGPSGVHKDTSQRSYNNTEWRVYEDKTMRVAVNNVRNRPEWAGDKYKVVAHNCQDFVSEVVKEYDRLNRGKLVKKLK